MLLIQLVSTQGGRHKSSDEKLHKHRVASTLQQDLFLANPNKLNIAKLRDTRVSPIGILKFDFELTVNFIAMFLV